MNYPFVSTDNDFRIEVNTEFDFNQSNPLQKLFLFSYHIRITNQGERTAQLLARKWFIKNKFEEVKIVEGPGVVGHTPKFKPGDFFEYQSFCPLDTVGGEMWGHFIMKDSEGVEFKIETPIFKFRIPDKFIDHY
ncbi:MAG: Co2+/Mg2+ efflux protein ApaG [Bacteriovoracaceae bacterium]